MARTEGRRHSDAARSHQTRERILRAAVDSLIEDGYAATSIGAIQARAEISRGALLHQYPNKAHLLVDAVRHLSDQQMREAIDNAEAKAAEDDWIDALWHIFATPLFGAVLELWVAARTDTDLREALLRYQRELHGNIRATIVANTEATPENFDTIFEMTLTYFRGLALTTILSTNHRDKLLADWRIAVHTMSSDKTP
ncbi:TetR/AcrR family transcriptional regulator [Nocardia iowensis]|uniref:TetR/AcrR family transcriptional regulator n=1 Tax=Nocardia iowensis TaxID=204891 RepID=A0ABX8S396_NOCIO|nr:TetR/AcrR family transcriptional regulator [Nocardia iowensis]QXN94366.1 TetR/AcrR family transcriptional regulator [Nocardia iowensis]